MEKKPSKSVMLQRIRDFDLGKALFILPNAFTMASIFCGYLCNFPCNSGHYFGVALSGGYRSFFGWFFRYVRWTSGTSHQNTKRIRRRDRFISRSHQLWRRPGSYCFSVGLYGLLAHWACLLLIYI